MNAFWTPANLARVTSGYWDPSPARRGDEPIPVTGVSIDSRTIQPGQAFIALRGDRFDGHDYLDLAAGAGAALLVVAGDRRPSAHPNTPVLRVPDTIATLQRLAGAYRASLPDLRVVGVTGSNGKTTTTRLIDAALSTTLRGGASIKSFNNHIGVPLTLLSARPGDDFLAAEMGMNHAGEIAPLTEIARPDVAVITSIGRAHIEHLGSLEAIAAEKASIFRGLREGGLAIAPAEAPLLRKHFTRLPRVVTFGVSAEADLRVMNLEPVRLDSGGAEPIDGQRFTINGGSRFEIPMPGAHNALNAAAAVAVARHLGINDREIARGLKGARPADMRLGRTRVAGIELVNDAYNASPESVLAALRTFATLFPPGSAPRRVLILGDMLELGAATDAAHDEVGRAIAELCPPDLLVTVGMSAPRYASASGIPPDRVLTFPDADDNAVRRVADALRPGDAVLLKASRRMGLERVVKALQARAATPAAGV